MILDRRTLQSTAESGRLGGYDGAKCRQGSKVHTVVDTLGHLLTLPVPAADEENRAQMETLGEAVQQMTDENIDICRSRLQRSQCGAVCP